MFGAGLATATLPYAACGQPSFVEGAVIRTILRDYAPGELGGGATLSTPGFWTVWTACNGYQPRFHSGRCGRAGGYSQGHDRGGGGLHRKLRPLPQSGRPG
jgi:hypothetical protein